MRLKKKKNSYFNFLVLWLVSAPFALATWGASFSFSEALTVLLFALVSFAPTSRFPVLLPLGTLHVELGRPNGSFSLYFVASIIPAIDTTTFRATVPPTGNTRAVHLQALSFLAATGIRSLVVVHS